MTSEVRHNERGSAISDCIFCLAKRGAMIICHDISMGYSYGVGIAHCYIALFISTFDLPINADAIITIICYVRLSRTFVLTAPTTITIVVLHYKTVTQYRLV